MATTIDPTVEKVLDQQFAEQQNTMRVLQNSAISGDMKVAELLRNTANQAFALVNAHAAGQLENGLASRILDQRSVMGQPQFVVAPSAIKPATS
jgi:TctA family transporter